MMKRVVVKRTVAMGDIIKSFVITDQLSAAGFEVAFSCDPFYKCVVALNPKLTLADSSETPDIDLDGAYELHPDRKTRHMCDMYSECASKQLAGVDFSNWMKNRPTLRKPQAPEGIPGKAVMICPQSGTSFEGGVVTYSPGRSVPDSIWQNVSQLVKWPCYWLGIHAPSPEGMVDLKIKTLDEMIAAVSVAGVMVSVDTGPAYLAEAMGIPLVMIGQSHDPRLRLNRLTKAHVVYPPLDCLNCQTAPCPIDATAPPCQNVSAVQIAEAVNAIIDDPDQTGKTL